MDSIQLQRLVDGELSFEEAQKMLQAAENNPKLWRTIASSFVESQMWRSEFLNEHDLKAQFRSRSRQVKHHRSSNISFGSESLRYLALAASLMLAVSVGFLMNGSVGAPDGSPDLSTLANSHSLKVPISDAGDNLNQSPAVYRMQLEDPTGNQFVDTDVPLYSVNSSEFEKYVDNDAGYQNARRNVAKSGIDLQQNVRFLSGRLNDGRRFVIPVRKYSFLQGQ